MTNTNSDSITIRITGKEINTRLSCLEKQIKTLKYANYIQLTLILLILSNQFFN